MHHRCHHGHGTWPDRGLHERTSEHPDHEVCRCPAGDPSHAVHHNHRNTGGPQHPWTDFRPELRNASELHQADVRPCADRVGPSGAVCDRGDDRSDSVGGEVIHYELL